MICLFCNKPLPDSKIENKYHLIRCIQCEPLDDVLYGFENEKIINVSFGYLTPKGKSYYILYDFENKECELYGPYLDTHQTRLIGKFKTSDIPITPNNIKEKLPAYLLFL